MEETMKIYARIVMALFVFLMAVAVWTLIGCDRPQVGSPEYQDPILDTSPYEPAEEYTYLVDIDQTARIMGENYEGIAGELDSHDMAPGMGMPDFDDIIEEIGIPGLRKGDVTAEANDSMVHAHAEYIIEDQSEFTMALSEIGAAEIRLPSYFDQSKWMGHVFLANIDDLTELGMYAMAAEMENFGGDMGMGMGMEMDIEMYMQMFGISDVEDVYNWMGDEIMFFSLLNTDFDPDGPTTYENVPFFTLMGVAATDTEKGVDMFENLFGNPFLAMMGINVERTEFEGHDAVIIPPPSMEMFAGYLDEAQLEQLSTAPDTIVVAVEDYVLMADEFAVKAALDAMTGRGSGTNRMATLEVEWNIDGFLTQFNPENAGPWVELLESEEFKDLLLRFYNATYDLEELGTSRCSLLVQDGETIELDVITSKESLKFFEAVEGVIAETPSATWEALGEMVGEILMEQTGMGMDYDYDSDEDYGWDEGSDGDSENGRDEDPDEDEGPGKPPPDRSPSEKPEGDGGTDV